MSNPQTKKRDFLAILGQDRQPIPALLHAGRWLGRYFFFKRLPIRVFKMSRVAIHIDKRRVGEAATDGFRNASAERSIARKADSDIDKLLFAVGDCGGHAEIRKYAVARALAMPFPTQRDNRHTHVECFQRAVDAAIG